MFISCILDEDGDDNVQNYVLEENDDDDNVYNLCFRRR